jgi:hypothetical protein
MRGSRLLALLSLSLLVPALARADGYFNFPSIYIPGDRLVLGESWSIPGSPVFTVLPYGDGSAGELGFVRSNVLWYCIDPSINHVMLGTGDPGTGNIGEALHAIRVDFTAPLVPPAFVHVQVQTKWSMDVFITLYDAEDNVVAAGGGWWSGAANLVSGSCGAGDPNLPKYMNGIWTAVSQVAVSYAVVSVAAPFTVESISWWEHAVPVAPVTWGHVKAIYRERPGR